MTRNTPDFDRSDPRLSANHPHLCRFEIKQRIYRLISGEQRFEGIHFLLSRKKSHRGGNERKFPPMQFRRWNCCSKEVKNLGYQDTQYEREYNGDHGAGWWWALFIFLSVIAALAYILIPNFLRARAGGNYNHCQSNLKNIGTALEMYSEKNNKLYPPSLSMLTPDYLKTIPTCPSGKLKSGGYAATYHVSSDGKAYSFYCGGVNHSNVGAGKNYPQYNSYTGLMPK